LAESPRAEEAEALRRRALEFLEEADEAIKAGRYALSCFFSEQSAQLYLKYAMLKLFGEHPRTHYVRRLIGDLIRLTENPRMRERLSEFASRMRAELSALEDAYLMSRYSAKEYSREDAIAAYEAAKGLGELLKEAVERA